MKRILLFLVAAVLSSTAVMAQEVDSLTAVTLPALAPEQIVDTMPTAAVEEVPYYLQKRHTLQVSAGYISLFYYGKMAFMWIPAVAQHGTNWHFFGNYGLQYYCQMNRWCRIGAKANWEMDGYVVNNSSKADAVRIGYTTNNTVSLVFSTQFTYLNRPKVQLYSGADVGAGLHIMHTRYDDKSKPKEDNFAPLFAFNLTPIGVAFGSWPVYGYIETNLGYDALIKAGLGVHF
ncbi:MAG: hypothetical protein IKG86_07030 [Paludibacteraceae bacterium]|nr:hypothetical protein [Paludibacteraceae bacterium]